jgi:NAD(P)-dependent dehydrogenase (short-subunit alcohol dehydrogenase family)
MTRPVHLILGANGGIGSALARSLAADALPVLAGRNADALQALAAELDAPSVVVDACDTAAVADCVKQVVADHGRIDGIANCVGSLLLKPAHLTKPEEFDETLRTNLGSAFAVVRAAAPAMRKTGGSVVLFSSAAARLGLANHEAIAAAKAGVAGLARSAAATYASWNIRFNVIAPGLVRTPLADRITSNEAALDRKMSLPWRAGCSIPPKAGSPARRSAPTAASPPSAPADAPIERAACRKIWHSSYLEPFKCGSDAAHSTLSVVVISRLG